MKQTCFIADKSNSLHHHFVSLHPCVYSKSQLAVYGMQQTKECAHPDEAIRNIG